VVELVAYPMLKTIASSLPTKRATSSSSSCTRECHHQLSRRIIILFMRCMATGISPCAQLSDAVILCQGLGVTL
jgi:hypothetical protein